MQWIISSKAGQVFGLYKGETAEEAFAAMVADGGGTVGDDSVGTADDWIIREPKLSPAAVERARELVAIIVKPGVRVDAVLDELRDVIAERAATGETLSYEISQSLTKSRQPEFVGFDASDLC